MRPGDSLTDPSPLTDMQSIDAVRQALGVDVALDFDASGCAQTIYLRDGSPYRGIGGTVGHLMVSPRIRKPRRSRLPDCTSVDEPLGSGQPARGSDRLEVVEVDSPHKAQCEWEIHALGDVDWILLLQGQGRQIQLRYR
jgi:hypothetical protein